MRKKSNILHKSKSQNLYQQARVQFPRGLTNLGFEMRVTKGECQERNYPISYSLMLYVEDAIELASSTTRNVMNTMRNNNSNANLSGLASMRNIDISKI